MTTDKLYYGCAYYDEYMPYDRIETDFSMMEEAGMNVIRIAESTWSTWEPQEGVFDFSHLHRMLDCAKKHNLSVIIGTPTYAIPSWLANKSSDILTLTHGGQSVYGPRQNMDITNPIYLKHAQIIIEKLMEEVKDQPHVIGFQLDNETKAYDTCSKRAQAMFLDKLKEQWPDINEFNHEFGLDYWSNRVNSWEDFPDVRGTINQSLAAEYEKFQRQLVTDFLAWQASIVSKYKRDDQFITQNFDYEWHNYSYGLHPDVDQFEAVKSMDVAGCDIYHPSAQDLTGREITVCGNISRGLLRSNYLVLETEAQGNIEWLSFPGQLRLQAYSHIGNGANMVEYWHWHSIHNAIESYWKGVLSHDLGPNRTYKECSQVGNEWKRIGSRIKNLSKNNRVAVIADNLSLTGLAQFPAESKDRSGYNRVLRYFCDALYEMNIEYDIIPNTDEYLSEYDYIFVPALYSSSEKQLQALSDYVKNGGNLVASYKTGFSDPHLKIYADLQPHILKDALGIHYDQYTYPKDVTVSFNDVTSEAREWMEMVYCDTATPLAMYNHKHWGKYAAASKNSFGNGHSLYIATLMGQDTLIEILKAFFKETGFEPEALLPVQVEQGIVIKQGTNDFGNEVCFILNYSDDVKQVSNKAGAAKELISDREIPSGTSIEIPAWDLAILEY